MQHYISTIGCYSVIERSSTVDVSVEQGESVVDGSAVSFHRFSYFVNHPRSDSVARFVVFSGVRLSVCFCMYVCASTRQILNEKKESDFYKCENLMLKEGT